MHIKFIIQVISERISRGKRTIQKQKHALEQMMHKWQFTTKHIKISMSFFKTLMATSALWLCLLTLPNLSSSCSSRIFLTLNIMTLLPSFFGNENSKDSQRSSAIKG